MARYFLDLPEEPSPFRFDPRDPPRRRRDLTYWGAVLLAMEPHLEDDAIDVYVTYDTRELPRYGDRVVAVVLGDEVGRIPRYTTLVRAVLKCYGTRPVLGAGPLRNRGLTGATELIQVAVRWSKWMPGAVAHGRALGRRARNSRDVSSPAAIAVLPLGTFNQLDLPVRPMSERATDLFFAGSVEHGSAPWRGFISPKKLARRDMLGAVGRLSAGRPDLTIDLRVTRDFQASEQGSPEEYSEALMASRICLAPRGTSAETFRLLEGLRYGCVVVSDRLPGHWFYEGSPIVQLDRWSDLEAAVTPLLQSPEALEAASRRSLAWWRTHCSEAAVGQFMAAFLNRSAPLAARPRTRSSSLGRGCNARLP